MANDPPTVDEIKAPDKKKPRWRAFAFEWSRSCLKEGRWETLQKQHGMKASQHLEASDLRAPWTPGLVLGAARLVSLSGLWPDHFFNEDQAREVETLRRKFLAAGIETMECFFEDDPPLNWTYSVDNFVDFRMKDGVLEWSDVHEKGWQHLSGGALAKLLCSALDALKEKDEE